MIVLRKDTNKTGSDTPGKLLFPELDHLLKFLMHISGLFFNLKF
jgi:hypothetical protein